MAPFCCNESVAELLGRDSGADVNASISTAESFSALSSSAFVSEDNRLDLICSSGISCRVTAGTPAVDAKCDHASECEAATRLCGGDCSGITSTPCGCLGSRSSSDSGDKGEALRGDGEGDGNCLRECRGCKSSSLLAASNGTSSLWIYVESARARSCCGFEMVEALLMSARLW